MPIQENVQQQYNMIVVNDFVIPSRNQQTQEQHRGQHFQIWFFPEPNDWGQEPEDVGYYIKDLGIGFGVFKKMDCLKYSDGTEIAGKVMLKDNMLINVGEAYIVVNLLPEGLSEEGPHPMLRLKIFGGANNGEIFEYNIDQMQGGKKEI